MVRKIPEENYKIIYRRPLFWFLVKLFYPSVSWGQVVFAFGNRIYAPAPFDKYVLIHEQVHLEQMNYSMIMAIIHFLKYRISSSFKIRTEIEAYQVQYSLYKHDNPSFAALYAKSLAASFSGHIYGKCITSEEAFKLITA